MNRENIPKKQITTRIPYEVWEKLRLKAVKEHTSQSALIERYILEGMAKDEGTKQDELI